MLFREVRTGPLHGSPKITIFPLVRCPKACSLLHRMDKSNFSTPSLVLMKYLAAETLSILGQRTPSLGKAITTVDLRGWYRADWKDVGAIGFSFPCLSSLSTWPAVQHWSRERLPSLWELQEMRSLRHLTIDIQVINYWGERIQRYHQFWDHPGQPFDLCELPILETLRIPLRLFMDPNETSIHRSNEVLPARLKTLVLFIELQLHCAGPLDEEESEWVGEECDQAEESYISDRRSCALTARLAVEFLQDIIDQCANSHFQHLRTLILEYKIHDHFGGQDWSFGNKAMGNFMAQLQKIKASFGMQGSNFSWITL